MIMTLITKGILLYQKVLMWYLIRLSFGLKLHITPCLYGLVITTLPIY